MSRNSKNNSLMLKREIQEIADNFYKLYYVEKDKLRLCSPQTDADKSLVIRRVYFALTSLDLVSKEFIVKEYFKQNTYKNWWTGRYSRSTFYRLLSRSEKEFIKFYYHEN